MSPGGRDGADFAEADDTGITIQGGGSDWLSMESSQIKRAYGMLMGRSTCHELAVAGERLLIQFKAEAKGVKPVWHSFLVFYTLDGEASRRGERLIEVVEINGHAHILPSKCESVSLEALGEVRWTS